MRYSLTREVFEYIKRKRSEGILAVELEEELGFSAGYILQLDKYATWEEYEEKLAIQRQKWHDDPKLPNYCAVCGKVVERWYRYCSDCSDERRRKRDRERWHRRMQDPEFRKKEVERSKKRMAKWLANPENRAKFNARRRKKKGGE